MRAKEGDVHACLLECIRVPKMKDKTNLLLGRSLTRRGSELSLSTKLKQIVYGSISSRSRYSRVQDL